MGRLRPRRTEAAAVAEHEHEHDALEAAAKPFRDLADMLSADLVMALSSKVSDIGSTQECSNFYYWVGTAPEGGAGVRAMRRCPGAGGKGALGLPIRCWAFCVFV